MLGGELAAGAVPMRRTTDKQLCLVSAGNGENASEDHVRQAMGDARLIAPIRKTTGQAFGETEPPLRHRKQQNAAVRNQAAAVEICRDFLARDGWKRERENRSVIHGGRGWRKMR